MEPLLLRDPRSGSTARIAAQLGFNCFEFLARVGRHTVNVIAAAPQFPTGGERPSWHGIPLLFPFPNRIRGGRFSWDGRDYDLNGRGVSFEGQGNAIHGFCLDRPWRVAHAEPNAAVGVFQLSVDAPDRRDLWPADFLLEVRYALAGATLRADVRIANPDRVPLPWGFGTHPYFQLPLAEHSQPERCLVQAPAAEEWVLTDCLPSGERRPVAAERDLRDGLPYGGLKLDDIQTGLRSRAGVVECVLMDPPGGLEVRQRFPDVFRELVVFTPPWHIGVCLEPYTCVTDAINLAARGIDSGWRVLEPGAEFRTWIEIEACRILV